MSAKTTIFSEKAQKIRFEIDIFFRCITRYNRELLSKRDTKVCVERDSRPHGGSIAARGHEGGHAMSRERKRELTVYLVVAFFRWCGRGKRDESTIYFGDSLRGGPSAFPI